MFVIQLMNHVFLSLGCLVHLSFPFDLFLHPAATLVVRILLFSSTLNGRGSIFTHNAPNATQKRPSRFTAHRHSRPEHSNTRGYGRFFCFCSLFRYLRVGLFSFTSFCKTKISQKHEKTLPHPPVCPVFLKLAPAALRATQRSQHRLTGSTTSREASQAFRSLASVHREPNSQLSYPSQGGGR